MGIFHPLDVECPPYVIPQIGQTGKQFRLMLCIEPHEVLIMPRMNTVGLGTPRFSLKPRQKIARAAITARRLIDPAGIGPDREISEVEY
jgi:hypothetical protein